MLKRVMGKASFCNVQDKTGNIQVYVARNELGDEPFDEYKAFKKMDIGDIVGVKGYAFTTKTGEKVSTQQKLYFYQRVFRFFRRNSMA